MILIAYSIDQNNSLIYDAEGTGCLTLKDL